MEKKMENLPSGLVDKLSSIDSYEKFVRLLPNLHEPVFHLKDIGITSRVLSHWKSQQLLNIKDEVSGWNKFSFADLMWLKIVQELREFGLPFKKIRKVKGYLLQPVPFEWVGESLDELVEFGRQTVSNLKISQEDRDKLMQLIIHPEFKTRMQTQVNPSLLVCAIMNIIVNRKEVGFIIDRTGETTYWMNEFYEEDSKKLFLNPFLFISITKFIIEFLNETDRDKSGLQLIILTEKEMEVLRRIRQKDLMELTIKFPQSSNKNKLKITTKKRVGLSDEEKEAVARILSLKNYQSVTLKTQGKGDIYIEKSHHKEI
jgi:DNA-binding transcriptional MerR regulator